MKTDPGPHKARFIIYCEVHFLDFGYNIKCTKNVIYECINCLDFILTELLFQIFIAFSHQICTCYIQYGFKKLEPFTLAYIRSCCASCSGTLYTQLLRFMLCEWQSQETCKHKRTRAKIGEYGTGKRGSK